MDAQSMDNTQTEAGDASRRQCKVDWLREREFYRQTNLMNRHARYFEPLGLPAFPSSVVPTAEIRIPRSSNDSALTAFAQLGALRLNARRAVINLVSRSAHYTIAEATRTISLQDDGVHDEGDQLQSGCSVRPTQGMYCRYVLDLPSSTTEPLVVTSFLGDTASERFCAEVPVSDFVPQFFCTVPLRTRNGIHIGTYCVFDDTPRGQLKETHKQFLRDISKTVSQHLELAIARQEHQRAEKAIRGIGCFVEGKTSIRDWWLTAQNPGRSNAVEAAAEEEGKMNPESSEDVDQQETSREIVAQRQFVQTSEAVKTPKCYPNGDEIGGDYGFGKATQQRGKTQKDTSSSTTHALVSRAANIIREAMDVQGVLFLDATIGKFGSNKATVPNEDPYATAVTTSGSDTDLSRSAESDSCDKPHSRPASEDVDCGILGFSTSDRSSINERAAGDGHSPASSFAVPETFLKVLLRKYPLGKCWDLTADGTSSSSDSEDRPGLASKPCLRGRKKTSVEILDEARAALRAKKRSETKLSHLEKLRKIFPNARSLVFFPLWDSNKERYFAGAMAWTNRPARIFTIEGELSFLSAFGNTIMAEVARLETIKADRAKSTFISSISHELRSPLHGIIGSVELLESTTTDAFQRHVIHTVETCSRTLLDTINHLLEFSKINNMTISDGNRLGRQDDKHSRQKNDGHISPAGMISSTSDVDLSIITEEVIESMFASHHARLVHDKPFGRPNKRTELNPQAGIDRLFSDFDTFNPSQGQAAREEQITDPSSPKVTTVLDIDRDAKDWIYSAQSGAWRRVLMNIYGNALKYTNSGFIGIRVKSRPISSSVPSSRVTLIVRDSGRGMSDDFQQSQMFTPFTQEDPLMPGTGLGLSMCKQIVKTLGGSMKINSKQGYGTEIRISVTMPHATSVSDAGDCETVERIKEACKELRGSKVALLGFEKENSVGLDDDSNPPNPGVVLHRLALHRLCSNWFELDVVDGFKHSDCDFAIVDSVDIAQKMILEESGFDAPPIIVVCDSPASALAQWQDECRNGVERIVEYISQPVGPGKLSQTLLSCRQRLTAEPNSRSSSINSSFVPLRRSSVEVAMTSKDSESSVSFGRTHASTVPGIDKVPALSTHQSTSTCSDFSFKSSVKSDTGAKRGTLDYRPAPTKTPHKSRPVIRSVTPPLSTSPTATSPTDYTPPNFRVLLVDDNFINLSLLSTFMSKVRVPFHTAENGLLALQEYKRLRTATPPRHVNCVFMDINMPVMDGMTSTREIRRFEREHGLQPTTIIALTGLASEHDQQEAFTSGINLFLTKPVRLKEIRALLDTL